VKRTAHPISPDPRSPRLGRRALADRTEWFTQAVGPLPPVYGERWVTAGARSFRTFEPGRSKLAAGIVRGWTGPLPRLGERWLYLGAATGTTASHVADLVGPDGCVYALERSPRPFSRLLALAERWSNLRPILDDAREPRRYAEWVPPVDGLYCDIAQPDQVAIVRANAELLLEGAGARVLVALKTASMGRDRTAEEHLRAAESVLRAGLELAPSIRLDPFHKGHYLVGGTARPSLFPGEGPAPVRLRRAPRPGRRRR
jgi:fibrillarin-like pre-rRNA processing protein